MEKTPLIIIAGPTGVGKSAAAVELALRISGEVISADSMQVYRGMDIGTAKITPEEMKQVPHHLLDIISPLEPFSAADFKDAAAEAARDIAGRGRIPIVTGGTGFYIQALLYDIDFKRDNGEDENLRRELTALAEREGGTALHARLGEVDPASALAIHPNNIKRMIRALEYYEHTGEPFSEHNAREAEKESPYNYVYFVMTDRRSRLYERIDRRADRMVREGLPEEVLGLIKQGFTDGLTSMQALGYHETYRAIRRNLSSGGDGVLSPGEKRALADEIALGTRHYAKRQLTWFRREKDTVWLSWEDYDEQTMIEKMLEIITEKGIVYGN